MFRSINSPTGLARTLTALSLLATSVLATGTLVGCGTDVTTAPEFVSVESDDGGYQPGEVPLPARRGVEAPTGLTLQQISSGGAVLTWNEPATTGLTALIQLNGVGIAAVSASTGSFTDNLAKGPGMYHYAVCFQNSVNRTSQMKAVEGEVMAVPDGDERRDDLPEDGR